MYTDGGIFENEPIGLAIDLINCLPEGIPKSGDPDRFFLFIAPSARKADRDPFWNSSGNDHITVAKAILSAVMGQSRFQDWITKTIEGKHPKVLAITSQDNVFTW